MSIFSVFEPPDRDGNPIGRADRFVFVRDGFSVAGFVFGPVWMLWHLMLLAFAGYMFIGSLLVLALKAIGASILAQSSVWALLNLLVALEAASLRRAALLNRGWRDLGIVAGDSLEAAERRFFSSWTAGWTPGSSSPTAGGTTSSEPTVRSDRVPPRLRMSQGNDVIGLFPKPGAKQ